MRRCGTLLAAGLLAAFVARPGGAGAQVEPVPREDPAPAAGDVPVPSPDPRGAGGGQETAPDAKSGTPAPAPDRPDVLRPVPAEVKPVEEIPVPETRPAAGPSPTVEGQAGAEPPERPEAPNSTESLKAREAAIDPATSVVAAAAIRDATECESELKRRGAAFTVNPSISEGACGVLRPVAIDRLSSGVVVRPDTQMLCRTALALDMWMSDVVVPAAKANFPDRRLTEFRQASTYVCRPRASEGGISEHARGSAIDIGAFVFDKGPDIGIAAQPGGSPEARFQDATRAGACGPFKTVLGPGTDADHATHFHLDIAARRNGATYCK